MDKNFKLEKQSTYEYLRKGQHAVRTNSITSNNDLKLDKKQSTHLHCQGENAVPLKPRPPKSPIRRIDSPTKSPTSIKLTPRIMKSIDSNLSNGAKKPPGNYHGYGEENRVIEHFIQK